MDIGSADFKKEMKTYKLYISKFLLYFYFTNLILMTLAGLFIVIFSFSHGNSQEAPPPIVGIFFIGMTLWWWYFMLRFPHTIRYSDDNVIEFISFVRKVNMAPSEIISIKPIPGGMGLLTIRSKKRKIMVVNQFDGFHEFLTLLKTQNPSVELRGC